jgi:hypothetical protein
MTKFTQQARELSIGELDRVSGGDTLGMVIDAAENYMNGLFGRLINAVHQPVTSKPTITLHPQ